jgi:uncharacterized protein (UPF0276 family)
MLSLLPEAGGLLDYLKVGPFMGRQAIADLATRYRLLLHLDDTLSNHAPPDAAMIERLESWVQLSRTPWTSEHIGFSVADVDLHGALITQPASALLEREEALGSIARNASALAQRLSVPLILENIPLFPNLAHLWVCEPDFVAEVLERTGCNLLVDLAHARVSADVLGYRVHDYLSRLPLERTVELHLSGPRTLAEFDPRRQELVRENARSVAHRLPFGEHNLVDAHAPLGDEDYALLEWTLARSRPRAISLEYYREPDALREQLLRLNEILGRA